MAKKKVADEQPKVKEDVVSSESGSLTLIDETIFEEGKTYKGSLSVLPGKRMFFKGYKKRDEDDDETTRKVDEGSMSCGSWAVYSSKNKIKVALTIENKVNMRIAQDYLSRLYANASAAIYGNFKFTNKLEKSKDK